jgi:hypothetical protein
MTRGLHGERRTYSTTLCETTPPRSTFLPHKNLLRLRALHRRRLEDDLLHLHRVEEVVALDRILQRHDLLEHEASGSQSAQRSRTTFSRIAALRLCDSAALQQRSGYAAMQSERGAEGKGHLLELILLLLQQLQRLREDGSDGTPPHLHAQVLAIRLVARPRDLLVGGHKVSNSHSHPKLLLLRVALAVSRANSGRRRSSTKQRRKKSARKQPEGNLPLRCALQYC